MFSPTERWHWPLRVGLLADALSKEFGAELKREMNAHAWAANLLDITEIAGRDQRCDVLLLPHGVPQALSRVLEFAPGLTASCVIVCSGTNDSEWRRRLLLTLEDETRANALAVLAIERRTAASWFVDGLLREISHNQLFDVALADSLKNKGGLPPVYLAANEEWIQNVRLSRMVATLMENISRPEVSQEVVNFESILAQRMGLQEGAYPLSAVRHSSLGNYLGESHDATTFAYLTKAVAPVLRRTPPRPPKRQLQAQVFSELSDEPVRHFRAGTAYWAKVRVGMGDEHWISSPKLFPEEELPPSKSGHRLTVVFSEPVLSPRPQVDHIFLPPIGSSTTCTFFLAAANEASPVQARVTVLYRNRVLQTAMLAGPMLANEQKATEKDQISFLPEVVVSPGMADLNRRASYDAALVINHTEGKGPQVLKIVDDNAELISTTDLNPSVEQIDDELGRSDWGAKDFRDIKAPGTLKLLRFLAVHGSLLYRGIVKQQFIDKRLAMARNLQLIAAKPGARLPVEYFYDRPSPDENATLCPSALKSLDKGECAKDCSDGKHGGRYICPLGFWGLTRVLEWHVYRPQAARELQNYDYALQQEKLGKRQQLPILDRALLGASDRANAEVKTSVSKLLRTMKKTKLTVTQSATWGDWKKEVVATKPSLLIVIPHLDIDSTFNVAKLEIGSGEWLRVDKVDEAYVHTQGCQPIVLLLGCETGKVSIPFEDFVSAFKIAGAAIVVSTAAPVLGRQATVVAEEFVSVLKKLRGKESATFGDVMLAVRRNMLRKGFPVVLSVSSYGDADWRL
jgi:hypothetical protein